MEVLEPKVASSSDQSNTEPEESKSRKGVDFMHCWWECKMMLQPLLKTVWQFPKILNRVAT